MAVHNSSPMERTWIIYSPPEYHLDQEKYVINDWDNYVVITNKHEPRCVWILNETYTESIDVVLPENIWNDNSVFFHGGKILVLLCSGWVYEINHQPLTAAVSAVLIPISSDIIQGIPTNVSVAFQKGYFVYRKWSTRLQQMVTGVHKLTTTDSRQPSTTSEFKASTEDISAIQIDPLPAKKPMRLITATPKMLRFYESAAPMKALRTFELGSGRNICHLDVSPGGWYIAVTTGECVQVLYTKKDKISSIWMPFNEIDKPSAAWRVVTIEAVAKLPGLSESNRPLQLLSAHFCAVEYLDEPCKLLVEVYYGNDKTRLCFLDLSALFHDSTVSVTDVLSASAKCMPRVYKNRIWSFAENGETLQMHETHCTAKLEKRPIDYHQHSPAARDPLEVISFDISLIEHLNPEEVFYADDAAGLFIEDDFHAIRDPSVLTKAPGLLRLFAFLVKRLQLNLDTLPAGYDISVLSNFFGTLFPFMPFPWFKLSIIPTEEGLTLDFKVETPSTTDVLTTYRFKSVDAGLMAFVLNSALYGEISSAKNHIVRIIRRLMVPEFDRNLSAPTYFCLSDNPGILCSHLFCQGPAEKHLASLGNLESKYTRQKNQENAKPPRNKQHNAKHLSPKQKPKIHMVDPNLGKKNLADDYYKTHIRFPDGYEQWCKSSEDSRSDSKLRFTDRSGVNMYFPKCYDRNGCLEKHPMWKTGGLFESFHPREFENMSTPPGFMMDRFSKAKVPCPICVPSLIRNGTIPYWFDNETNGFEDQMVDGKSLVHGMDYQFVVFLRPEDLKHYAALNKNAILVEVPIRFEGNVVEVYREIIRQWGMSLGFSWIFQVDDNLEGFYRQPPNVNQDRIPLGTGAALEVFSTLMRHAQYADNFNKTAILGIQRWHGPWRSYPSRGVEWTQDHIQCLILLNLHLTKDVAFRRKDKDRDCKTSQIPRGGFDQCGPMEDYVYNWECELRGWNVLRFSRYWLKKKDHRVSS